MTVGAGAKIVDVVVVVVISYSYRHWISKRSKLHFCAPLTVAVAVVVIVTVSETVRVVDASCCT